MPPCGCVMRREVKNRAKGGPLSLRAPSDGKGAQDHQTIQIGFVFIVFSVLSATLLTSECVQFIAVRKTLEANMQMSNMFPPGHVLWAMRDSDLHPSHRSYLAETSSRARGADKLRLFEVLNVEKVFSQIVFARDMLTYVPSLTFSGCLLLTRFQGSHAASV